MDYWQILRSALGKQQLIMSCAAGAVIRGNKVLLVRNHAKRWSLPGGLQELNESITDTVVREFREELGVTCDADYLVGVYTEPRFVAELTNGDRIQPVLFFFRMKDPSVSAFNLQKDELLEASFFPMDDLPDGTMPCCREKIADLLAFEGTVFVK